MAAHVERQPTGDRQVKRWVIVGGVVVALVAAIGVGIVIGRGTSGEPELAPVEQTGGFDSSPGQEVSDRVMRSWTSGDPRDIEAAYDPAVTMVIDGDQLAADRAEIGDVMAGAIDLGNTYEQIGPVTSYTASDGDLYVATLVEVVGPGHPEGAPIIGFYRVHEGKVIAHVFIVAEQY
jgi:hypothetical protein